MTEFRLTPVSTDELPLVVLEQEIEEVKALDVCNSQVVQARHLLRLFNHCFSIKQRFTIGYQADSPRLDFCGPRQVEECTRPGAHIERHFPVAQQYWRGDEKGLVKLLCWTPTGEEVDFNLEIEVTVEAQVAGSTPQMSRDLGGTARLNVYGRV